MLEFLELKIDFLKKKKNRASFTRGRCKGRLWSGHEETLTFELLQFSLSYPPCNVDRDRYTIFSYVITSLWIIDKSYTLYFQNAEAKKKEIKNWIKENTRKKEEFFHSSVRAWKRKSRDICPASGSNFKRRAQVAFTRRGGATGNFCFREMKRSNVRVVGEKKRRENKTIAWRQPRLLMNYLGIRARRWIDVFTVAASFRREFFWKPRGGGGRRKGGMLSRCFSKSATRGSFSPVHRHARNF